MPCSQKITRVQEEPGDILGRDTLRGATAMPALVGSTVESVGPNGW